MPWFKVDDKLHTHKKAVKAGEAMALWVLAGSWCAEHLTDGFVPDYIVERIMPNGRAMADRLVEVGLWIDGEFDGDDGWQFKDWDEYQPTRDEVEARREYERDKKRRQRRNSKGQFSDSRGVSPGDTDGDSPRESTRPDPTRPVPDLTSNPSSPETVVSEEARSLTRRFALAVRDNGHPIPKAETKAHRTWLDEMDRLVRIGPPGWDGPPPSVEVIARVIDYATSDEFWRANVRSVPKLRKQFSTLRLKAEAPQKTDGKPKVELERCPDCDQPLRNHSDMHCQMLAEAGEVA